MLTNKAIPGKTNIKVKHSNNSPTDLQNFNNSPLTPHSPIIINISLWICDQMYNTIIKVDCISPPPCGVGQPTPNTKVI